MAPAQGKDDVDTSRSGLNLFSTNQRAWIWHEAVDTDIEIMFKFGVSIVIIMKFIYFFNTIVDSWVV